MSRWFRKKSTNISQNIRGLQGAVSFVPTTTFGNMADSPITVCFNGGAKLATFGASPDYCFRSNPLKLPIFLQAEQIKRVLILDTKRVRAESENFSGIVQDTQKITAFNLKDRYKDNGIEAIFHEYDGIAFDVPDLFELPTYLKKGFSAITDTLLEKLEEGFNLREAFWEHQYSYDSSEAIQRFCKDYKHEVLPESAEDKEVLELVYYPTAPAIFSFIQMLYEGYKVQQHSYVHCAAGSGRTGFYLACLIMFINKCNFPQAVIIVRNNYKLYCPEIMLYNKSGDKFYKFMQEQGFC